MLGTRDDAEDAAQETFLRAFEARAQFDQRRQFGPWIYRIARNVCIDRMRSRRPRELTLVDTEIGSGDETPADLYERADTRRHVHKAILSLPKPYRRVLLLRYAKGMSYCEIGSALGISEAAVGTRLVRAKGMVRNALVKCL